MSKDMRPLREALNLLIGQGFSKRQVIQGLRAMKLHKAKSVPFNICMEWVELDDRVRDSPSLKAFLAVKYPEEVKEDE